MARIKLIIEYITRGIPNVVPLWKLKYHMVYLYSLFVGAFDKVQVYIVQGLLKSNEHRIKTLFIGNEQTVHQFASLAYSKIDRLCLIETCRFYQIYQFMRAGISEIVAVRVDRPFMSRFLDQGCLLLPNVSFDLNLDRPIDSIIKRMSRRRRRDIRKIESSNLRYRVSKGDDDDVDLFYWKMYLPYAKSRFGKGAYIKTYAESKAVYRKNGGIIFITLERKPIAGILFRQAGKMLQALNFGALVDDQSMDQAHNLAGLASLFFLIKWARENGVKNLNYGVSMPFLNEGIFTYKKEWGMNVNDQRDGSVCALKLNSLTNGTLSFLTQNPFIVIDKRKLKGVVFIDHKIEKSELQQIMARHYLPNLDSLEVIAYYKPDENINDASSLFANSRVLPTFLFTICQVLLNGGFRVEVSELAK